MSVDECSGEVSIRCSDLNTNQSCTIKYQQDGMYLNKTIQPSSMVSFPLESELFQVVIKNGSTILEQGFDNVVKGKQMHMYVCIAQHPDLIRQCFPQEILWHDTGCG